MKLIKGKIEVVHPDSKSTRFVGYPNVWLSNKEKIISVLDPGDRLEEITENGRIYKILYAVCHDEIYDELLTSDLITPADLMEARAYADMKFPPKIITTDQDVINAVLAKVAMDEPLSQKERDAIDPTKEEKGLSMTINWLDTVEENHGKIT